MSNKGLSRHDEPIRRLEALPVAWCSKEIDRLPDDKAVVVLSQLSCKRFAELQRLNERDIKKLAQRIAVLQSRAAESREGVIRAGGTAATGKNQ